MRIVCGFCGQATPDDRCQNCGHDPVMPYTQRGLVPAEIEGRLDVAVVRRQLAEAKSQNRVTVDAIAEYLGVSPRTVRRWQELVRA